jgi:hypothetical protein
MLITVPVSHFVSEDRVGLIGLVVLVLAAEQEGHGFKPSRGLRIFKGDKNT